VIPRVARTALLGIVAAGVLATTASADETKVLTGHIATEQPDWVYVPFDVPPGTNRVDVSYDYNHVDGNALDIGLFDQDGTGLGDQRGFEGWSGGARTSFTVSASDATPGYRPEPIEPGRWNVVLGPYTVGASGIDYRVEVTLHSGAPGSPFVPNPAPTAVAGRGPGWFRGDLHLHTVNSDGKFEPQDIVDGAKAAGLDFFVSTDHNTDTANASWGDVARADLLTIGGEEVTTRNGHWGAIGLPPATWIDWRYRAQDGVLPRFVGQVHRAGGLAVANHPSETCKACNWSFPFQGMDAVEVWNSSWGPEDEAALATWDQLLRQGSRIVAVGGSDAHRPPDVIGRPQTVVRSARLDDGRIIDGIRAGRVYLAESKDVQLSMTARRGRRGIGTGGPLGGGNADDADVDATPADEDAGATTDDGDAADIGATIDSGDAADIGDTLDGRGPTDVALRVQGATGDTVSFHTDRGEAGGGTVDSADATVTTRLATARWVRAEVRHPDGTMAALTDPIWLAR
jgi:predicted metal-dependent phosphoesterase TrpH